MKDLTGSQTDTFFSFMLRIGDDPLVLGQRLAEWCGHGPVLEEDIALSNIALDCIGQATLMLKLAGEIEGRGRDEDALAFFRAEQEFKNSTLVELPNGDFGYTITRQFFFSAYAYLLYGKLTKSSHDVLKGIAEKAVKEEEYHLRHARSWMLRLGDGTQESHDRVQNSVNTLWEYTYDLFLPDVGEEELITIGLIPDRRSLKDAWNEMVADVLKEATLARPEPHPWHSKKTVRDGKHTEHLGHILSEMQSLARAHPGVSW